MPSFLERIKARKFSSAASNAVDIGVNGDTQARLAIDAGGKLLWGSGSATGDVNLYRDSADVLKTDDTFKVPTLFIDSIEVDTTGAVTNDVLTYDGTKFTAASVSAGGGGATTFDGLTDVTITSPEKYQTAVYDGTGWINEFPTTVSLVNNAEATTLQVGEVVYLFGGTGNHASVKRADNDSDSTSAKTVGMVAASIPAGGNGPVVTRGYVTGMDLSVGYTAGQTLYLASTAGQFTTTKPYAPNHLVYVGVVARATNNGIIYVATQNGYELDEIHDVDLITTPPASGDFLKYNGSLWVNDAINLGTDTVGNYMSGVTAGTGITVTHTPGEGSTATIAVTANTYQPSLVVSDTLPSSPVSGMFWYESDTGKTFVYYDSYWVEVGGQGGPAGATGATGNFPSIGFVSQEYYTAVHTVGSNTTTATNQTTYYLPIYVPESLTFDRIAVRTGTNFAGGPATVRLGIYNNSGGKPTTVVLDAGTVSCTGTQGTYAITINQTLTAGWYWLAFCTQGAATTNTYTGSTTFAATAPQLHRIGSSFGQTNCWSQSSVTGAFATAGALTGQMSAPLVGLRVA